MSRGFDGFEIDDFRESSWDESCNIDRTSSSLWEVWEKLQDIRREEEHADRLDCEGRESRDRERPALAREERVEAILSQRIRTKYTDRNKDYSLRNSEIHTLGEVGKFRVVAVLDLAEFAYNVDRARAENDVENLESQGLAKQTTIADPEHNPTQVVTLTKEGHKLLSRGKVVDSGQAIYHGLKKPKEAFHDADLYRLYYKVSDEIDSRGGKVLRVQLDYEMKRELYARLARASADKRRDREALREGLLREGSGVERVSGRNICRHAFTPYFVAVITDLSNLAWKLSFGTLFVVVRGRNVSDSLQFRPHECRQALPDPFAARSRKHSGGWHSCSKALSEKPTGRHS